MEFADSAHYREVYTDHPVWHWLIDIANCVHLVPDTEKKSVSEPAVGLKSGGVFAIVRGSAFEAAPGANLNRRFGVRFLDNGKPLQNRKKTGNLLWRDRHNRVRTGISNYFVQFATIF